MNMRWSIFAVAFISLIMVPFAVQATMMPVIGSAGNPGLSGEYYKTVPNTIHNIAEAQNIINSNSPLGTFMTTAVDYGAVNDHQKIVDFLGADGGTFAGKIDTMSDAVLLMTGFLEVTAPKKIQYWLGSDDGASLTIGGVTIINNDNTHPFPGGSNTGTADFLQAGFYAVEIMYFNKEWSGGQGNAELEWRLASNTGTLVSNIYKDVNAVPEPTSLLLIGTGLIGLAAFRRKFKS